VAVQTVQVAGFTSGTYVPSISGFVISGDGHVSGGYWVGSGSFGTPTVKNLPRVVAVPGLGSAKAFGTVTISQATVKPVGGVPSAQQFGALSYVQTQRVLVAGVMPSGVYVFTLVGPLILNNPMAIVGGHVTQFGHPFLYGDVTLDLGLGVPSAQAFGQITLKTGPVTIIVGSVPSAAAFGVTIAYIAWLLEPSDCLDLVPLSSTCEELELVAVTPIEMNLEELVCE